MIYFLLFVLLVFLCIFLWYQNNRTDITTYSVTGKAISETTVLVHLSDFHSKPSATVLEKTAQLHPDIICITGDYINDRNRNHDAMLAYAGQLSAIAPVVYIPGNHERRLENFACLMRELKNAGFYVLQNETITLHTIHFLGLDENQASFEAYKARKNGTFQYPDMQSLFRSFEKMPGFRVVLSHFPENFAALSEMQYRQYDFDLQLSGHAHGGQWILPLFGPIFAPGQGFFPKYARGSHGNRPRLLISRGIGNAEFPFRLFNHPEIIQITIQPDKP